MPTKEAASLAHVAAAAGVSVATASRVLSPSSHPVSAATRARVLAAAGSLDFVPNLAARSLVARRSNTLGVIVHDMTDEYFAVIARGVEDVAHAHGLAAFVCNSDRDPDKELDYVRKLRALRADGLIFAASGFVDDGHERRLRTQLNRLRGAGAAVVRLGPHQGGRPDVGFSTVEAFALVAEHLAALDHRRVAFLPGPARLVSAAERTAAFHEAFAAAGFAPPLVLPPGDFSREGGEFAGRAFAAARGDVSAIVVANDQMAIGLSKGLRTAGVDVPGDVSVVGFGDIPQGAYVDPALTTAHLPLYELGAAAAQRCLDVLDGNTRRRPVQLPVALTVRASTARRKKRRG